jgi:hypothetical protein
MTSELFVVHGAIPNEERILPFRFHSASFLPRFRRAAFEQPLLPELDPLLPPIQPVAAFA